MLFLNVQIIFFYRVRHLHLFQPPIMLLLLPIGYPWFVNFDFVRNKQTNNSTCNLPPVNFVNLRFTDVVFFEKLIDILTRSLFL